MTAPRVTVTIPTYNRATMLRETLRSVLEQSYSNIEVFVSDNASDDDTGAVVESFGDPRVHYLRNERNLGHFVNLSRGLHLGTAEYVAILPDDDHMLPGHLEQQIAVLDQHPEVGFVHSAFRRVTKGPDATLSEQDEFPGGDDDWIAPAERVVRRLLTETYYISYATALFRRSVISADERFAEEDRTADDVGLALRVARRAGSVAYRADPRVAITFHADAHLTSAGGQDLVGGDYVLSFGSLANEWRVKRRFVDRFAGDLVDPDRLRADLDRHVHAKLLRTVKRRSGPSRRPATVGRLTLEAARSHPTFLLYRPALRYLGASLVGPKGRELVRRRLPR